MKRTVIEILPKEKCLQISGIVNDIHGLDMIFENYDKNDLLFYLPTEIFNTTQTIIEYSVNGFIVVFKNERYSVPTCFTRVIYDVIF